MTTLLRGEHLAYEASGTAVLRDVSIEVSAGERVAVTGPSGSGKTTLLTVLAGLLPPSGGRVLVDGVPLDADPQRRRLIALVLQGYGLVSLLTAAENVEVALRAAGRRPRDAMRVAESTLTEIGLADYREHLVDDLSGGQQQRVAVARALALAPRVLLADEPTAEQDSGHRAVVLDRLMAATDGGAALVIATHDLEVAERCDRVVDLAALQSGVTSPGPR